MKAKSIIPLLASLLFACDAGIPDEGPAGELPGGGKADSAGDSSDSISIEDLEVQFSFPIECALGKPDPDANTFSPDSTFDATSLVLTVDEQVWDGVTYKSLAVSYFAADGSEITALRDSAVTGGEAGVLSLAWDYVARDRLELNLSDLLRFQNGQEIAISSLNEWPFGPMAAACTVN